VKRPTLQHRLEYVLYLAGSAVVERLPAGVADGLGASLGRIAHRLGLRRETARAQVRAAFPERDDAWVHDVVRQSYEHIGREAMAMLRMSRTDVRSSWLASAEVVGIDRLLAAWGEGRGLVLVGGHLGNWELGAAVLASRDMPVDAIAKRLANPLIDRAIADARARLGLRIMHLGGASKRALQSLREGRVVGFVADQDAGRAGVFVDFMGRPASTHRGPALLAIRSGAPMFVGLPLRRPDGGYHLEAVEVRFDREGDLEEAVRRGTQAFSAVLEEGVRRAPGQYFWQHRRWKSRPPEPSREEPEPAGEV